MRLVLASNNAKKLAELKVLFAPPGVEIVAQGALGVAEADEPHHTFIENALAKGAFEVEGAKIDLRTVKTPTFIHAARKDHISPFASVYKGVKLFSGDVTFVLADSGHIAGVVNPPAANKYRYWISDILPPSSDGWMAYAKEHPGSWWPLWSDWLTARSGKNIPPPVPSIGAKPAPGSYVLETLETIRGKRGA